MGGGWGLGGTAAFEEEGGRRGRLRERGCTQACGTAVHGPWAMHAACRQSVCVCVCVKCRTAPLGSSAASTTTRKAAAGNLVHACACAQRARRSRECCCWHQSQWKWTARLQQTRKQAAWGLAPHAPTPRPAPCTVACACCSSWQQPRLKRFTWCRRPSARICLMCPWRCLGPRSLPSRAGRRQWLGCQISRYPPLASPYQTTP